MKATLSTLFRQSHYSQLPGSSDDIPNDLDNRRSPPAKSNQTIKTVYTAVAVIALWLSGLAAGFSIGKSQQRQDWTASEKVIPQGAFRGQTLSIAALASDLQPSKLTADIV